MGLLWGTGRALVLHSVSMYPFCPCLKKSEDAEFKGKEPVSLVEDTCLQAVAWLLIAAFNQIFSED